MQRGAHVDVLARFERDMGALAGAELPRPAQGPGLRRVSDLLPEAQLREWAAQCQAAHGALNDKARPAPLPPGAPPSDPNVGLGSARRRAARWTSRRVRHPCLPPSASPSAMSRTVIT